MIGAGLRGFEPQRGVTAGQHVLLDAECGNIETVDYILRSHDELDVLPCRNVELVDLALAFDVFNLPHPLFSHDINLGRVGRRSALLKEYDCAPDEESQHHEERNHRPADFEDGGTLDLLGFASGD